MAIGYACIHIGSETTKLSTVRLANASIDNLRRVITSNLKALQAMILYNVDNGIKLFRISSDIIPLGSHPAMQIDWVSEFKGKLFLIGEQIKHNNIRVSMHPGQYTVLNSPNAEIFKRTVDDLKYHCAFLDALGCDTTCKIILHVGGVYSDKNQSMKRFIKNYSALDENIKARLVIENDDKSYTAEDVMIISNQTGLPVIFDYLHHILNNTQSNLSPFDWIDICGRTWGQKDGKQKVHYSQSDPNVAGGAHSRSINTIEFLKFYNGLYDKEIDLMLEVKDKNLSAVKCILVTEDKPKIQQLEREWARYKYLILSQSASIYNAIRTLLKNKSDPNTILFYTYIDEALALNEDKGAQVNAAQHVWGYVRKKADAKDQKRFATLMTAYKSERKSLKAIKSFLFRLAKKQEMVYLLESLYFYV